MKFEFSKVVNMMKPSEIRELNKMASTPGLISLSGGMPSPETFPVQELKDIMAYIMDNESATAMQYGNTLGNSNARMQITSLLERTEQIKTEAENIIINTGSQQGLYEIGSVMANQGDTIITEEPTYVGAISAFSASGLKMEGIPVDENGMKVELLEEKIKELLKNGITPRFIYLIPTFQNPTGYTMPLERRKVILELSKRYDIPIVEDNPYGRLRYYGKDVQTIRAMPGGEDVIYLGTFSKVMTPGLRIGYTVAPVEVMDKFNLIKQALDLASNSFSQAVAAEYIKRGIIYKQVEKTRKLYSEKRDAMIKALDEEMSHIASYSKPEGGMFVYLTLKSEINTRDMISRAIKNGVAYVSGQAFTTNNSQKSSMRLNFTFSSAENLREGIKRIKKTVEETVG